jgi:hypothetical protein
MKPLPKVAVDAAAAVHSEGVLVREEATLPVQGPVVIQVTDLVVIL